MQQYEEWQANRPGANLIEKRVLDTLWSRRNFCDFVIEGFVKKEQRLDFYLQMKACFFLIN
jgi:hypothetical protein